MASFSISFLFLCLILLFSPAISQSCSKQTFKTDKLYTNCTDLPTLNSFLHYSFNSSNSSLSIAFKAPPSKPEGWVAWGVNLNGTGMAGAQALIAFKSNGSLVVKKYNIISYSELNEVSELAVDVWDVSAESDSSTGDYIIFGSVKVPENKEKLNHIWQVGPSVTKGRPDKHDFAAPNLGAKAAIELVSSTLVGGGNTTGNSSSTSSNSTGAGYSRMKELNGGLQVGLFVVVGSLIGTALW